MQQPLVPTCRGRAIDLGEQQRVSDSARGGARERKSSSRRQYVCNHASRQTGKRGSRRALRWTTAGRVTASQRFGAVGRHVRDGGSGARKQHPPPLSSPPGLARRRLLLHATTTILPYYFVDDETRDSTSKRPIPALGYKARFRRCARQMGLLFSFFGPSATSKIHGTQGRYSLSDVPKLNGECSLPPRRVCLVHILLYHDHHACLGIRHPSKHPQSKQ